MELIHFGIGFLFFWVVYFEQQRRNQAINQAWHDSVFTSITYCLNATRSLSFTMNTVEVNTVHSIEIIALVFFHFHYNSNIMVVLGILAKGSPCNIWCVLRSKQWWEVEQTGLFGENWWKENLCPSHSTFNIICNALCPYIQRKRH